jgi:hypothetical protein
MVSSSAVSSGHGSSVSAGLLLLFVVCWLVYIQLKTRGGASHYLSFASERMMDRVAGEVMAGTDVGVGEVGLRSLFNAGELFEANESIWIWEEYMTVYGADVCMAPKLSWFLNTS